MALCRLGQIYVVPTDQSTPPKKKYALCIDPEMRIFFWISREPRRHGCDQLPISAGCHQLIRHPSYMNLARVFFHSDEELRAAHGFPCISQALAADIIAVLQNDMQMLAPRYQRHALAMLLQI